MTIPYNAVWYSCYTKFIDKLKKDNIYDESKKEIIKLAHQEFYKNVKNNLKEEFYKNHKGELKIFKYNKWVIINKKEYKINYKKNRDKYVDIEYSISPDDKATERALEANNMHYLDAKLVSFIIKKFDVLTVHDCFGIRLCELHLVMDSINEYYSRAVGRYTYSIHIII
jgi:hypothetical protein